MRRLIRKLSSAQDEGFTLIELLIVVAILAIMVSIVTISVTGIMDSANSVAMSTEKHTVQLTIDTYNTWDVYAQGKTDISAYSTAIKLSSTTSSTIAPFAKYLASETKYCYTWDAKGASLAGQICPATP